MSDFFRRYLLAGFVFQSVVIGGGYATGRELIEFFMPAGPAGGLLGMAVTMLVWGAVMAVSFELVRLTRSYDYKSFFTALLGRGWFLFEIAYVLLLVLVLAVLGAASGEIVHSSYGWPKIGGTLALMAVVGLLLYYGSAVIEKALAASAIVLFAGYIVLIVWSLSVFGDRVTGNFASVPIQGGWFKGGVTYAAYNMACVPAVFFCIRHLNHRCEAIGAGLLAGPLAMLPGVLFYIAMMGFYPEIGDQAVPSVFLLTKLGASWFQLLFEAAVLWTLVATGVGLLHAINERIAKSYQDRAQVMPRSLRAGLALGVMAVSVFAADAVGLIGLIAKGYGLLTYVFIAVLVLPVLTIGVWKIIKLPEPSIQ